jgi:hypothetical protein
LAYFEGLSVRMVGTMGRTYTVPVGKYLPVLGTPIRLPGERCNNARVWFAQGHRPPRALHLYSYAI